MRREGRESVGGGERGSGRCGMRGERKGENERKVRDEGRGELVGEMRSLSSWRESREGSEGEVRSMNI